MEFFDAHTHVQFKAYDSDRDDVIKRAQAAGVKLINVGTQKDTSKAAVDFAEKYDGMYAAIGLHPVHTSKSYHDENELGGGEAAKAFTSRGEIFDKEYYGGLARHAKTVAIGECGLDYFHFNEEESREEQIAKQKAAFAAQIEFSHETGKPLMIHCREAFADVMEMLQERKDLLVPENPGVVHFFTGTVEVARAFMDLGFSFTFGGAVTFPPRKGMAEGSYDNVIRMIPPDKILSETDAPYVAPAAYRGKRNEPAYVAEAVKRLAELKQMPIEKMAEQIMENAKRIFPLGE